MTIRKTSSGLLALVLLCSCGQAGQTAKLHTQSAAQILAAPHALDPLSQSELERAVTLLKSQGLLGNGWYLQVLNLAEPTKNEDGNYPAFDADERDAYAVVLHHALNERYECVINLKSGQLISKAAIKGQPAILNIEYDIVKKAVKSDLVWQASMRARGITNFDDVFVDTWAPGDLRGTDVDPSHRLLRSSFYLAENSTNQYARPLEGVSTIFDMTLGKIVQVTDTGIKPISPHKHDYSHASQAESPKPSSCDGSTHPWQVSGTQVSWKNWRFRFQMHPREGLVLYNIGFVDNGRLRSILDRVSLSEMVVPYADPGENWHWRAAFDEGDYGIGLNANPLRRGVHFPADGQSVDTWIADNNGNILQQPNSIAIFERSSGVFWSHYNSDTNLMLARASKELVITFMFTVGNYDYGISWIFKEDGSIQMNGILSGMLLAKGHELAKCGRCSKLSRADEFGTLIDTNLIATAHQHFFNFRLDFAVDGPKNSVAEVSFEELDDSIPNPYGNAFTYNKNQLFTESEAMRNPDASTDRHWYIYNPNIKTKQGHLPGYAIKLGDSAGYKGKPHSITSRAAEFLKHSIHVTQYHPQEMHAAGDFPNQNEGEGIPVLVRSRDNSIVNQDLVVWVNATASHIPDPGEWPIMSKHQVSLFIKPMNFFEEAQGITEL